MLVDGGTGWAVQMAIDTNKGAYFFEQNENSWFLFNRDKMEFEKVDYIPTLTKNFAGIGTREINENGKKAIAAVYKQTFE